MVMANCFLSHVLYLWGKPFFRPFLFPSRLTRFRSSVAFGSIIFVTQKKKKKEKNNRTLQATVAPPPILFPGSSKREKRTVKKRQSLVLVRRLPSCTALSLCCAAANRVYRSEQEGFSLPSAGLTKTLMTGAGEVDTPRNTSRGRIERFLSFFFFSSVQFFKVFRSSCSKHPSASPTVQQYLH